MTLRTPIITVNNLSKVYEHSTGTVGVFSNIHMHVAAGEFVSVIGPSGCGKSTLLNILAGIDEPTTGLIHIRGCNGNRLGETGYMPQKPTLLPWKTVRQNVMLSQQLRHTSKTLATTQANKLLRQFGLIDFANHYPRSLSGGMAQKTALLRTILHNKTILLVDEPFGGLDALTRLSMQLWLADVCHAVQSSVLLVTHDIREAIFLSDRVYVFSNRPGTIVAEVNVDLPRPRQRQHLNTAMAKRLETKLEGLLLTP